MHIWLPRIYSPYTMLEFKMQFLEGSILWAIISCCPMGSIYGLETRLIKKLMITSRHPSLRVVHILAHAQLLKHYEVSEPSVTHFNIIVNMQSRTRAASIIQSSDVSALHYLSNIVLVNGETWLCLLCLGHLPSRAFHYGGFLCMINVQKLFVQHMSNCQIFGWVINFTLWSYEIPQPNSCIVWDYLFW